MSVALTNNLCHRVSFSLDQDTTLEQPRLAVHARNNLFFWGSIKVADYTGTGTWTARDNLFDHTSNLNYWESVLNSNNGYTGATALSGSSGGDVLSVVPDYLTGTLGNSYYPTTGTNLARLINAGSRSAAAAQLYHHTVKTNNVKEGVEAPSTVDIGFHSVACANGVPIDSDADGLADYFEDANGNGQVDTNETDPALSDTDGDGYTDLKNLDLTANILVNAPSEDYGNEQNSQWQPKVVVLGDVVVAGYWDSNEGIWGLAATNPDGLTNATPTRMVAYSVSIDDGRTFADMGVPPRLEGEWGDAGDPVLAVDRASETIYYVATSERYFYRGVPFWKSVDGGMSFIRWPTIRTDIENTDYPWIAVDDWPGSGQHDAYVIVLGTYNSVRGQWLTVSTDGVGGGWTDPVSIGPPEAMMPQMVVGCDHVAYVAWRRESPPQFALQMCAVSNRGASVSTNRTICALRTAQHAMRLFRDNASTDTNDWFKAFVYPALAVNPTTTRSNHLYVAYLDKSTNANDRADVFFTRSDNGGVTWASPLRVNLDGTTSDQWMPSVAVGPDGNKLFIGWLDRRKDTNNSLIDVYGRWGTIATNGTVAFFTNDFRITTESFPPAYGGSLTVNTNIGYYDPVWPSIGVNLHWHYDWWFEYWEGLPGGWPPYPHVTDDVYAHETGEHKGAYADANCVYLVWPDNRSHSQGTRYAGRRQADIRMARLPWPGN